MKAFAYLRVSGSGQIQGDGFTRQLLTCSDYATTHNIEIVEVFREQGVSGTKELDDRPALSDLFAALEVNGVKTVIIEKLDRLARDLLIQETIVADMIKKGYTLLSASEPDLCSQDPSRILIRQVFGAVAQYEKAMIVMKLRGARQRKKALTGKCEGQHAYGATPEERTILAEMVRLRTQGLTCREITRSLNFVGLATRSGRPWHRSSVAKILARAD